MGTKALHFYPGHFPATSANIAGTGASMGPGLLILFEGKTALHSTKAWGGPSKTIPVSNGPNFTPTPAGTYVLLRPKPYFTRSWKFSEIPWGTPIKESPTDASDVWYKLPTKGSGKETWASTTKSFGITKQDIKQYYEQLYGVPDYVPDKWLFNAFGPVAVRFFKDKNNNRVLDRGSEHIEGAMFHTTAENEAQVAWQKPVKMTNSHGCIHLQPKDRNLLINLGGLKAGVTLVIHPYGAKYSGPGAP